MCASTTTTNDEIMSTSLQAQEYFPFNSDSVGVFCCNDSVSGFTPMKTSSHPLNHFIFDISAHGFPQPKLSHISHLPMNVDPCVLPRPMATTPNAACTPLREPEKNVAKKCIVLVEYFPQSRNQEGRVVLPTLVMGGPVYGRVGQRVWIGRAYKVVSANKDTQEESGVFKTDDNDKQADGAAECNRRRVNEKLKWIWDWQPATDNEVVEATRVILGSIQHGFNSPLDTPLDTPFGVERQAWECTKCSEDHPGVGQKPKKKWTFVLHWKRVKSEKVSGTKGRSGKVKMESTKEAGLKAAKGAAPGTKLALHPVGGALE